MNIKILALLLILFLFPIVSAVEITTKESINKDETFLAKISGNLFEPLREGKIIFKRNHIRVPIIPTLIKIEGDFYIFAQTFGKEPGNYSMTLEGVRYYYVDELIEEDIVTNFLIVENSSDFFIEPAIIQTDEDFSIEIQNLKNYEITVESKFYSEPTIKEEKGFLESLFGGTTENTTEEQEPLLNSIILKSGEKKKIDFQILDFVKGLNNLEISSENSIYMIPVFSLMEQQKELTFGLNFEQQNLKIDLILGTNTSRIVYLFNNENKSLD